MSGSDQSGSVRWAGFLLAAMAFPVYLATLSAGAYPGRSAALIVEYTGLFPHLAPPHPIWGGLVSLLSRIPAGSLATRLNLLSAVCGAAAVGLLYRVVAGAIFRCVDTTEKNRAQVVAASVMGGVASALFLAFCLPFWIVSTRAHPAAFHVLLLLFAVWLLARYAERGSVRTASVFAFIYGIGTVEFATFIILAPLAGSALVYFMARKRQLTAGSLIRLLLCGAAGLLLYLVPAWWFYDSPGYHLREYSNFWQVVWIGWRDQYLLIAHSLPRKGWLIVLVLTVIPWLTALASARRALNGERDWTFYGLHLVMTGLALALLFNIKVTPWSMLGWNRLLVTPYVLAASVYGYLTAYWYLLPALAAKEGTPAWRRQAGLALVIPALACALVAPFRNHSQADGRSAAIVERYAREVIAGLEGRTWLVTDGVLDAHLRIAAHEMNRPLRIISLRWSGSEVLMRYAASLFDDARLRNFAQIGMMQLLQVWLSSTPDVREQVALMAEPDLWIAAGAVPVPNGLVFLGASSVQDVDPEDLIESQRALWKALPGSMTEAQQDPDGGLLSGYLGYVRRHISLMANNTGFFLEDLQRPDAAREAYLKATQVDPANLSALLNLRAMAQRNGDESEQKDLDERIVTVLKADDSRQPIIWSLSRVYGYVRDPEVFARLGWYWAASGRPGMGASGLKKAMDLLPDDRKGILKPALADMYLMQDDEGQSEALYYELLVENPQNQRALLGMARLEMKRGRFEEAAAQLRKAQDAGVPPVLMEMEWAALEILSGKQREALDRLTALVDQKPEIDRAWAMLMSLLVQQNDGEKLARYTAGLEKRKGGRNPIVLMSKGHLALMANDTREAREQFEQVLALNPRNGQALEWLIKLDMLEGRNVSAAQRARELLRLDPNNPFANRVLGSLQLLEGEYALAEDSLRRSLQVQKNAEALNNLAWLLQESGLYKEAEEHARAAVAMDEKNHFAWDTLGVILMKVGRMDEAAEAFERSLTIVGDRIQVLLHMADLLVQQGQKERAREILAGLGSREGEMSAEEKKLFQVLRRRI